MQRLQEDTSCRNDSSGFVARVGEETPPYFSSKAAPDRLIVLRTEAAPVRQLDLADCESNGMDRASETVYAVYFTIN
jgi:hypothetical protein